MNAWSWLEFLGERVVAASWQATWLIGAILLLQRLLRRRLSPRWRYALWLPVMVRLALPATPPSSFSAFQWVPGGGPSPADLRGAANVASPRDLSAPIRWWKDASPWAGEQDRRDGVGDPLPVSPPGVAEGKVPASMAKPTVAQPSDAAAPETAASSALAVSPSSSASGDPARRNEMGWPDWSGGSWDRVLIVVWVGGILLWLVLAAAAFARCQARIRRCSPVRHPGLLRLWAECQAALGVDRNVCLVESTIASGPALFGFRRLWLLLPPGFAGRFTVEQQRHVFLHELAHLRRRDIASHWALAMIQAVHWFNPVVWLALARVRAAREEAADALALEALGQEEARDYGLTVLHLVEACSGPSRLPGLVGILDGPGRLEERIDSIARFRPGSKVSRWPIVLLGLLALGGLTDVPRAAPVEDKASDPVVPGVTLAGAEGGVTAGWVVTNGPAVRVKVVDDATGEPLAGAEVVSPSRFFTTGQGRWKSSAWFTDSSGEVTIHLGERDASRASEEWLVSITARRSGFAPRGRRWLIPKGVSDYRVPEVAEFRLRPGRTVGGVFRDEAGRPVAGIRVRVIASNYQYGPPGEQEYSEFWQRGDDAAVTVSDAQGRWLVADFPADLNRVKIECIRPDGMVHRFEGGPDPSDDAIHRQEWGAPMDVEAFLAQKAELVLPSGHTLRGRVVDPNGQPVAGARVRSAFGHNPQTSAGETRSDPSGRFAFPHRTPIEWILTAEAPGFAITSVVVPIGEAEGMEHDIRLNAPNPVRLKVVDTSGKPLANVVVAVDPTRLGPEVLDYSGRTDGAGTLVWTNAPLGGLTFRLQNPGDNLERWVRLTPGEREKVVRVRTGKVDAVVVSGRCVEAGTGAPIEVATLAFRDLWTASFSTVALETFETLGQGRFRLEVPVGWFQPGLPRVFQLRLWAPGVGRVITELRDFDEGDWELTVPFRRGGALQGTIRLPDGRPAADAMVAAPLSRYHVTFPDRGFFRDGEDLIHGQADGAGRYGIDEPGGDAAFMFQHPQGFLEIPASRLRENGDVTLAPYGRVEGVFRSSQGPLAGATVTIRRDMYGRSDVGWSLLRSTVSAADGTFAFTNVPSGTYVLNRMFTPAGGSLGESHPMRVRVESGSTTRVTYGGEGRAVVGRVTTPALHWEAIGHRLVAQPSMERPRWPDPNRFATREHYDGWMKTYEQLNEWFYQRGVYGVLVQRDGTFRVEDVPAGVYELELIPYDPRLDAYANPPLAALVSPREGRRLRQRVVMPPVTDADRGVPLDLGVLEFPAESKGPVSGR
jgi:beta-lactamase regulating signal transducer with metallopeptidase domain